MKKSMIAMVLLMGANHSALASGLNKVDSEGVACTARAEEKIRAFFKVVDMRDKLEVSNIFDSDKVVITAFENTTPGSWDQKYVVDAIISFDRAERPYSPESDQKLRLVMTGDYNCDGLKIKSVKSLK